MPDADGIFALPGARRGGDGNRRPHLQFVRQGFQQISEETSMLTVPI